MLHFTSTRTLEKNTSAVLSPCDARSSFEGRGESERREEKRSNERKKGKRGNERGQYMVRNLDWRKAEQAR